MSRRTGVLLHPTSLDSPFLIGDLGPSAHRLIDWLARSKVRAWQILPLCPPDQEGSPYSSRSAFACDPLLLSLTQLMRDGLLREDELTDLKTFAQTLPSNRSNRIHAQRVHGPLIELAVTRWLEQEGEQSPTFQRFRDQNQDWLEDVALFEKISELHQNAPWWTWPSQLRDRSLKALDTLRHRYADEITRFCVVQYLIDQQWRALKEHCATQNIEIIGDMPIYVDHNSADVWAHSHLFDLVETPQKKGQARVIAGVPPDAFSDVGQRWGNPIYRWDRMKEEGYAWWIKRLTRALCLTDTVRIDHFRALSSYWEIPASAPDARVGQWVEGPGLEFFEALKRQLGHHLPLIAEDLGLIDEPVRELLRATGLPGMKVLQFAFGGGSDQVYLPHLHTTQSVVYTGTHDNNTTRGWWESLDPHTRSHLHAYLPSIQQEGAVWSLIRTAIASVADLAIIPIQDLLNLDQQARMNQPGTAQGNWSWRLEKNSLSHELADSFAHLNQLYGRGISS